MKVGVVALCADCQLTINTDFDQYSVEQWLRLQELNDIVAIGELYKPVHLPANQADHRYQLDARPSPTLGDMDEVAQTMQDLLEDNADGTQWLFERTIYQGRHHQDYQRIVHLFARVDEFGILQDVCSNHFMTAVMSTNEHNSVWW